MERRARQKAGFSLDKASDLCENRKHTFRKVGHIICDGEELLPSPLLVVFET
jgi:hypothetical protein